MKTCCGYSLEAPRRGASNEYPQHVFVEKQERYQHFSDEKSALSVAVPIFIHILTEETVKYGWTNKLSSG